MLTILPIAPVLGSTGSPTLGVTNTDRTQPTTYSQGTSYVDVVAGSDTAVTDGPVVGYFAIDFGTFGGAQLVTFSGAQFSLYLSKDGLAQISTTDIKYARPTLFSVNDLTTNAGWHTYTETNGTFYVGQTTSGQEVITGPIPAGTSSAYEYIKIYDGSTTSVAVSAQDINILPSSSSTTTVTTTTTAATATTTITAATATTTITAATATTTITRSTAQTETTTLPMTITQSTTIALPTTIIQPTTIALPTTIIQPTTQTETIHQPTTTTTTMTTTSISTSAASTFSYAALGATTLVILIVATLAAWVLRGRRP